MTTYTNNLTGTKMTVEQTGRSFKTTTVYPATTRTPEEVIVKSHRHYSAVEKKIAKMGENVTITE